MDNADESSIRWAMIKGVILSQLAIIKTLMRTGAISKKDILKELDAFIDSILEAHPDAIMFYLEPMRTLKDAISLLPDDGSSSIFDSEFWLSDFIGKA